MKNKTKKEETTFISLRTIRAVDLEDVFEKIMEENFDVRNPLCDKVFAIVEVPAEIVKIATIDELYDIHRKINSSVIGRIEKLLETGGRLFYEETWSDEANNDIRSVSTEGVFFDDEDSSYPLEELGFDDAVYILDDLVKREKREE